MPRINVEDELFRDPRWFGLLQIVSDPEAALGKLVMFWFLAQKFWSNGEQIVPRDLIPPALLPVIQAGFAEEREDGIYVRGSRERFAWLEKRREAGRLGGLANAKQKQANAKQTLSKPKQTEASSSSSFSVSLTNESLINTNKGRVPRAEGIRLSADFAWEGITDSQKSGWREAYPAVDLDIELRKAAEYIRANPTKRKKNWARYLNGWLSRTQDRGGTARADLGLWNGDRWVENMKRKGFA